jgi:hypothetical protein
MGVLDYYKIEKRYSIVSFKIEENCYVKVAFPFSQMGGKC